MLMAAALLGAPLVSPPHKTQTYQASDWPGLSKIARAAMLPAPALGPVQATTQTGDLLESVCGSSSSSSSSSSPGSSASTAPASTSSFSVPAAGSSIEVVPAVVSGKTGATRALLVGATASSGSATAQSTTTPSDPGTAPSVTSPTTPTPGSGTSSGSAPGSPGSLPGALSGALSTLGQTVQTLLGGGSSTSSAPSPSPLSPLSKSLSPQGSSANSSGQNAPGTSQGTGGDSSTSQSSGADGSQSSDAFGASAFVTNSDIGCDLIGLGDVGATAPGETSVQAAAVNVAMGLLGTPYVWGGESQSGFDCSGLVQFVFDNVGVYLPRVAQDQFDFGPAVPPGDEVVPGDLVFFGSSPTSVEHVGIFAGDGLMIDAPYTGAVVRFDPVENGLPIVGVTSPGGQQIA